MKMLRSVFLISLFVLAAAAPSFAQATGGPKVAGGVDVAIPAERSDAATNQCHTHSTGATCTLTVGSGPTSSAYVTGLDISVCENGTGAAAAAPLYITTTGFSGNPQYQVDGGTNNAGVLGTCHMYSVAFSAPMESQTPGTSPTFVMPTFASGQTISLNVYYRLGWRAQ